VSKFLSYILVIPKLVKVFYFNGVLLYFFFKDGIMYLIELAFNKKYAPLKDNKTPQSSNTESTK
jgi:hypothetical protein